MSDQQSPSEEEFKTSYEGDCSKVLKRQLRVTGHPRSANREWKGLQEWKEKITREVLKQLKSETWSTVPNAEADECYFYMAFHLLNKDEGYFFRDGKKTPHNRYNLDVDNLVKAALDAIVNSKLIIEDDKYVKGIKVFKEPVKSSKMEKLSFRCITTKTFTITEDPRRIPEGVLMPGHWKHPMQYIVAVDEEGREGRFIDNKWGLIFIDKKEKEYHDAVPGYNWGALKEGDKIYGCMVFKREHGKDKTPFHWIHKWSWW